MAAGTFAISGPRHRFPVCGVCQQPVRRVEINPRSTDGPVVMRLTCHGVSMTVEGLDFNYDPAAVDWKDAVVVPPPTDSPSLSARLKKAGKVILR